MEDNKIKDIDENVEETSTDNTLTNEKSGLEGTPTDVRETKVEPGSETVVASNQQQPLSCNNCGAVLEFNQRFCPTCGQDVAQSFNSGITSPNNQFNTSFNPTTKKTNKKPIIIIVAIVIAIAAIVAGVLIVPKLLVSVDDLCAHGDYLKAYEKASGDEKEYVKAESIAAEQSAVSADNLKNPSSFKLREVYYKESENDDGTPNAQLVLYINGTNSYGGSVTSYWLYAWSNDKNDWELFNSVSDLTEEENELYDDEDEKTEKLIDNITRKSIKNTMEDGIKLSKAAVQRINNLFEEDKLDSVESIKMK